MAEEEDLLASFLNEVSEIPVPSVESSTDATVIAKDDRSDIVIGVAEPVVIASKPLIRVNTHHLSSNLASIYQPTEASYKLPTSSSGLSGGLTASVTTTTTVQRKKFVRKAAGEVWVDETLSEWPENDFRLFIGDLGKETTDQMLTKEFSIYKSFAKAKIVRDHAGRTKGYGFASFLDPFECAKALREKNGKYLGARPMKISKSTWKDRDIKEVKKEERKKQKMDATLGLA